LSHVSGLTDEGLVGAPSSMHDFKSPLLAGAAFPTG